MSQEVSNSNIHRIDCLIPGLCGQQLSKVMHMKEEFEASSFRYGASLYSLSGFCLQQLLQQLAAGPLVLKVTLKSVNGILSTGKVTHVCRWHGPYARPAYAW